MDKYADVGVDMLLHLAGKFRIASIPEVRSLELLPLNLFASFIGFHLRPVMDWTYPFFSFLFRLFLFFRHISLLRCYELP